MEIEELRAMANGLKIALKYAKGKRFQGIEGFYGETLVAQKLVEYGRAVKFHGGKFDLEVNGTHKIEVKCGKPWPFGASASFGNGKQITEEKFDYCVFVIIDRETFDPVKFFVFSREELEECAIPRPILTRKYRGGNRQLFYYRDYDEFVRYSEKAKEPMFRVEKKVHMHPEKFKDRWDKIGFVVASSY